MAKYEVYIEFGDSVTTTVEANSVEEAVEIAVSDINCGDGHTHYIETRKLNEEED